MWEPLLLERGNPGLIAIVRQKEEPHDVARLEHSAQYIFRLVADIPNLLPQSDFVKKEIDGVFAFDFVHRRAIYIVQNRFVVR